MEELKKSLGIAIRRHRKTLNISQDAFADTIGMHRTYFGAIERGERNVSLDNLERIAQGLGASLSELFAEAESGKGDRK